MYLLGYIISLMYAGLYRTRVDCPRSISSIRENMQEYVKTFLFILYAFPYVLSYSLVFLHIPAYTYLDERREYTRACKTHGHGIHTNNTMQERTKKSSCN